MDEPPSQPLLQIAGVDLSYIMGFASVVFLLLVSAWVSASEVAFFSLRSDDLDRCKASTSIRDKRIIDLISVPLKLLTTILFIKVILYVGMVTLSAFMMWGLSGTSTPGGVVTGAVTLLLATSIVLFGEIIPRTYVPKSKLKFAQASSSVWTMLVSTCKPFTLLMVKLESAIENRFEKASGSTPDYLNQALELADRTPETTEEEKEILRGIIHFGTINVRQVMRPRSEIDAADIEMNFHDLMKLVSRSGYSRLPVYRKTLDKVEGVIYIKDLLPFMEQDASFEWQKLLRPGFFVPQTKKIDLVLKDFQEKHVHMAIVTDENGKTAGLITLEDVIEEIIGEIHDETDETAVPK